MTSTPISPSPKERASLSTSRIVFLVIAAAAPLASMIGNLPIALGLGNGAGTPGAFAIAGIILLCFAVGYAAMSRRIVATGAFYTYITEGLGTTLGVSSAYIALVAYLAFTFGLAAFFGYFTSLVLGQAGLRLPWLVYAIVGIFIVGVLGYRSIDLSSAILGALMIGEVIILAIFDIAVIHAKGFSLALPANAWSPHAVFTPGLGVSLMVAFTCFVGFESAALYGEEARDPKRSIPVATYTAVISIAIFYLFTAWVAVGAIEPDAIAVRANKETGELMFNIFTRYGGEVLTDIMGVLVCFSILASYLAIHNAAARYIFALGREWLLLPWFGEAHPKSGAPHRASMTVSVMTLIAVIPFALTGLDPFKAGVPVLIGIGSFGIIFLQAFAAIAILVYLRRHGGEPSWVMLATWFGAIGLICATIFVGIYFKFLATSDATLVGLLPLLFPLVVIPFAIFSVLLKFVRPKAPSAQDGALIDEAMSSPKIFTDAGPEFLIRDSAAGAAAWVIKYKNVAGSEIMSGSKPSFEIALAEARNLRDQRGAKILELIGLPAHEGDGGGNV
ncbi:MAG: APC family permease [Methylovirgula sp.]|uniref:APC family permease n=1 Tax=Methylovirgula sp. TaxID=1978224 RepID=UPI0030766B6D